MAIDLNIAPGEGEDEHEPPLHEEVPLAGHHFDLNMNPGTSWSSTPLFSLFMCTCWWFFFAIEDELEAALHEEPHVGLHVEDEHEPDIAHGEEEHEADVAHGEEDLHESDESG